MDRTRDRKGVEITCPKCGYRWVYRGKLWYSICPNCRRWVETPYKPKEEAEKE
jgi:DNA-directed RNA polymerase subunit RPC12/RpoP